MKLKKIKSYLCSQNQTSEKEVLTLIENGETTVNKIIEKTNSCGNCGCREKVQEMLDKFSKEVFFSKR